MITRDEIYNYVESQVNISGRPVYCASRLEPVPEFFPACFITENDHFPRRDAIALDFSDEQVERHFEVHVHSNLVNGALSEAHDIMSDVEAAFREMYFIETYCGQTNNLDPTVVHLVARFTRLIGGADTLNN